MMYLWILSRQRLAKQLMVWYNSENLYKLVSYELSTQARTPDMRLITYNKWLLVKLMNKKKYFIWSKIFTPRSMELINSAIYQDHANINRLGSSFWVHNFKANKKKYSSKVLSTCLDWQCVRWNHGGTVIFSNSKL